MNRLWSPGRGSPAEIDTPSRPQAVAPASPASEPPAAAPAERTPSIPAQAERPTRDDRSKAATSGAAAAPSNAVSLVTAQLCGKFSTSGASWQCTPVGDSAAPGPIVLYTRVRSPRDIVLVHRWYRGDALRKTVNLTVRANASEGYRTYSRQTVDAGQSWRVEVSTIDGGDVLYEQRVSIR
jgi:hypothetical protein